MTSKPIERLLARADAILEGNHNGIEDWRDALDIYKSAAEMGSAAAWSRIGDMYTSGTGVKENQEKAIIHFKKAISLGDSPETLISLMAAYLRDSDEQSMANLLKFIINKCEFYDTENLEKDNIEDEVDTNKIVFYSVFYCALGQIKIDRSLAVKASEYVLGYQTYAEIMTERIWSKDRSEGYRGLNGKVEAYLSKLI